jgi:Zn-dependent M16 (insulinase) family peptidase
MFSGSSFAFDFSGSPEQIPTLSNDTVRDFHGTHYRPGNVLIFSCGPFNAGTITPLVEDVVAEHMWADAIGAGRAFQYHYSDVAHISASFFSDSVLAWSCPSESDARSETLLRVLAHGLWQNPAAAFRRWLVQWSSTRRLSAMTGYLLDFPNPLICIHRRDCRGTR